MTNDPRRSGFRRWPARAALLALVLIFLTIPEVQAIKRMPPLEARGYPEAVLITARKADKFGVCSGALVASNVVLTAAHCVEPYDAWEVLAPYAKAGPAGALVRRAVVHPGHKPGEYENDLALLILEKDIDIGAKFPRLQGGELLPLGTKLEVVGRVSERGLARDRLFRSPVVTLVGERSNIHVYGGNPPVVEKGDSGGPVYTAEGEKVLVAVVSGFVEFSSAPVPTDVYAPLNRRQREWITEAIEQAKRPR